MMGSLNGSRTDELAALLALADAGSYAKAGEALSRHPTVLSKRVVALEERLGVRLVQRNTRHVTLTHAGEELAGQVRAAWQLIEQAERRACDAAVEVRGKLRLALPAAMGRRWIAPMLPDFMKLYPRVEMDVDYSEQFVDLIESRTDVAVRIGSLNDSQLYTRRLADHQRILCASPEYLARHGTPSVPADLLDHNCLQFKGFSSFPEWRLSDGERSEAVVARGSMVSNDAPALLEAARAGLGILGAGEWLMERDVADGALLRVLPDWSFDVEGGIFIVRPSKHHASAHVNAFCDWLIIQFKKCPPWKRAEGALGAPRGI